MDEVLCDIDPINVSDILLGNHPCGSDMMCMSLDLMLLLLLWEVSYIGYQRYHLLQLSLWLLQNNVVSSFPKPGNFFSDNTPLGQE